MVRAITPPIMNSLIVCFCHRLRSYLIKWPAALVLLCFGALVQPVSGQVSLSGTVTNLATGRTLQGARVAIKSTSQEAITDSQGVYRFNEIALGDLTLVASYTGLDTVEVPMAVAAGAPVTGTLENTIHVPGQGSK